MFKLGQGEKPKGMKDEIMKKRIARLARRSLKRKSTVRVDISGLNENEIKKANEEQKKIADAARLVELEKRKVLVAKFLET